MVLDETKSLKNKLQFACNDLVNRKLSFFPVLESFVDENELDLHDSIVGDIKEHCSGLIQDFGEYFPENVDSDFWIRDPFSAVSDYRLPDFFSRKDKEEIIDLSCDETIKHGFKKTSLADFWLQRLDEFPNIASYATKFLIPLSTTYKCAR
mgnify:CR=1 FL=1